MSICITAIDEKVKFTVKGSFADRTGKDQPYSFTLVCDRVDPEEIDSVLQEGGKFIDFFSQHTHEWAGVLDADRKPVEYSEQELAKLFKLPGLPLATWRRYMEEIAFKAKN